MINLLEAEKPILDPCCGSRIDRIPQFIPVGIVNDHHSITWMEEIVEDQAQYFTTHAEAVLYCKHTGLNTRRIKSVH